MVSGDKHGTDWDATEVRDVVNAYFMYRTLDIRGQQFVKMDVYRKLSAETGRTAKSIERKFQNISAVLDELGIEWIRGLAPLRNFQKLLSDAIEEHLDRVIWNETNSQQTNSPNNFSEPHTQFNQSSTLLNYESAPKRSDRRKVLPEHMEFLARKFDPTLRDLRNRSLGQAGESIIYENEKAKLIIADRAELAQKVEWVSRTKGDGAGYDILSFEPGGRERFVEVKTTRGWSHTPFFMTRNEIEFAKQSNEQYSILRLYDFERTPRAFELKNPIEEAVHIVPDNFKVSFR